MGLIETMMTMIFGGGRNVVAETVEVFRENSEKGAARDAGQRRAALAQFAAEFQTLRPSRFNQFIDGINRLPRPMLALGTIGLFVTAMVDPIWFSQRMEGIALVPEPLWWLLGAIVSFYFGARHQAKGQDFRREVAASVAAVPQVMQSVREVQAMRDDAPVAANANGDPFGDNPALADWSASRR